MDERHWWIATNLQQSFKSLIEENALRQNVEQLISAENTLNLLHEFFTNVNTKVIFFALTSIDPIFIEIFFDAANYEFKSDVKYNFVIKYSTEDVTVENFKEVLFYGEFHEDVLPLYCDLFRISIDLFTCDTRYSEDVNKTNFLAEANNNLQTLLQLKSSMLMNSQLLKLPKDSSFLDFKKCRITNIPPQVIADHEEIVTEWICKIEDILKDSLDERLDIHSGLMQMLTEWKQRLRKTRAIMDQLKTKECKTVLALLVAGKSKVIKSWKSVDSMLTDFSNDVKEKVKYLESFGKRFEDLQVENNISILDSQVIPDFVHHVKQIDALSKLYAKNGFLGALFNKISYQIVQHCINNLSSLISHAKKVYKESSNPLWKIISHENLKQTPALIGISKALDSCEMSSDSFTAILHMSLKVCGHFEELYNDLIDNFGGKNNIQYNPQLSGVYVLMKRFQNQRDQNNNIKSDEKQSITDGSSMDSEEHSAGLLRTVYGMPFTDANLILGHVKSFMRRMREVISLIETLRQFVKLIDTTKGLPQLLADDWSNSFNRDEASDQHSIEFSFDNESDSTDSEDDLMEILESLSKKLLDNLRSLKFLLQDVFTFDLIINLEDDEMFKGFLSKYLPHIDRLESTIMIYIKKIFSMKWTTMQQLNMLTRFECVYGRTNLKDLFEEKYTHVIHCFSQDLENIEQQYELHKENPPKFRDSPITSCALLWCHSLYERIEKPMKILKSVKIVHDIKRYETVLKHYNKIASTLNKFKEKWVLAWNTQVLHCTSYLDVTLLAQDIDTKKIIVYSDPRVLEIFADAKTMLKFGLPLPKAVSELCQQESKFRHYKQRLEDAVSSFYSAYNELPDVIQQCIRKSVNTTLKAFQPALSLLKWNSLNLDAFLFKLEKSVEKFQEIIKTIQEKLINEMEPLIDEIQNVSIFSENLQGEWNIDDFLKSLHQQCEEAKSEFEILFQNAETTLKSIQLVTQVKEKKKSVAHGRFFDRSSLHYSASMSKSLQKTEVSSNVIEEQEIYENLCDFFKADICSAVKKCFMNAFKRFHDALRRRNNWNLKINVKCYLKVPNICFEPQFDQVDTTLETSIEIMNDVSKSCYWYNQGKKFSFYEDILGEKKLKNIHREILNSNKDILLLSEQKLLVFETFSFLWRDDINLTYQVFEESHSNLSKHHNEVCKFVDLEKQLESIPDVISINIVSLYTRPIKLALQSSCSVWKYTFVQKIQQELQSKVSSIVEKRDAYFSHMNRDIESLVDLQQALEEIDKINDLNNHIDELYLPIEIEFHRLFNEYNIQLTKEEVENIESLRDKWSNLVLLGDKVSQMIMGEKRAIFEQKLDQEVKEFVIDVIQFRNDFDSKGPCVPGISPNEAVVLLKEFQVKYDVFDQKRETLHSVQKIFGIAATPFVELTKTGKELVLLTGLYEVFQQYIDLDQKFRGTLWADVDLDESFFNIKNLWASCLSLPKDVQTWFAYKDLHDRLNNYLNVFPLLQKLASKEIKNRHWLQVMQVAKKSFQLEANVFQLKDILDIPLVNFKAEIENILENSKEESVLETKLRKIEEDWSEQAFVFESYKGRGNVIFNKKALCEVLDVLEDAKMIVSSMLSSRHVKPFHEEAAAWAVKLNDISEIILLWQSVEELWTHLESIFTTNGVAKDLPQQFAMFSKADRSYMKLLKKSAENPNISQCCLGGDVSRMVVLKDIQKDLEICFKSLTSFLDQKRRVFPRLNFIPNKVLLSILSKPFDVVDIVPYVKDMIPSVHKIETQSDEIEAVEKPASSVGFNQSRRRTSYIHTQDLNPDKLSVSFSSSNNGRDSSSRTSRIGSIINQNLFLDNNWIQRDPKKSVLAVLDEFGEKLSFSRQIPITNCVEKWLSVVLQDIKSTIFKEMCNAVSSTPDSISIDEVMMKKCSQVCFMTYFYIWSSQSEKAIIDIRVDRKSFTNMNKKFGTITNRLIHILNRSMWRSTNVRLTNVQKMRIESTIGNALYLRDLFEDLTSVRKVRDVNDFEWKQTIKCVKSKTEESSIQISVLNETYDYHNEFLGVKNSFIMSPPTDRCMVYLLLALQDKKGGCVTGSGLSGKSQVIKGISYLLGQYLFCWDCKLLLSNQAILQIFSGVCEEGCFVCFEDLHFASREKLSALHYYLKTISQALLLQESVVQVHPSLKITLKPSCGIFTTTSSDFINGKCPVYIKEHFRITNLVSPDIVMILRSQLIIGGFKCAKELSQHIKMLVDVCKNQILECNVSLPVLKKVVQRACVLLSHQDTPITSSNENTKAHIASASSSVNTFSQTVSRSGRQERLSVVPQTPLADIFKAEALLLVQAFQEVISCRLTDEDWVLLKLSLSSIFGVESETTDETFLSIVNSVTQDKKLSSHKNFMNKVSQLYQLSQLYHGIIVCGNSKSGKTTCMQVLMDTLRTIAERNNNSMSYRLEHVNVLAVSSLDNMLGFVDNDKTWVDGIFTTLLKRANQQQGNHKTSTWICLDGPLHQNWCSQLYSILDETKVHVEFDLRKFHLTDNVKIIFETDKLSDASPDLIAKMGVLYIDNSVVGWRAVAESWLVDRPEAQKNVLQRAFYRSMDKINYFVQEDAELVINMSEVALFTSCLNLLTALFKEHVELGGDVHVERLFIFSLIWCVGGLLKNEHDKNQFNSLMLSVTNVLPDDDSKINVFDYYVDESGEWDSWGNKLAEIERVESSELFGEIYVDTITTVQLKFLLHLLSSASFNVLLIGGRTSGKTSLMSCMINKKTGKKQITKCLSFSKATTCASIYQILDKLLVHRRGFVYGGKNNKAIKLFLDDINIPENDICDRQSSVELLSQIIDQNIVYSMGKGLQVKFIEDMSVTATMSTFSSKDECKFNRLLGNFSLVHLPKPSKDDLNIITSEILEASMTMNQGLSLPQLIHEQIVNASMYIYSKVLLALNNDDSATCLYHTGLLKNVFNMIQRCPEESRVDEDENYLFLFWLHEMKRFLSDRFDSHVYDGWFNEVVHEAVEKYFKWEGLHEDPLFITFSLVTKNHGKRQAKQIQVPKAIVRHAKVNSLIDTKKCFEIFLEKYSHETNNDLSLDLHENNLSMLIKFHHALSQDFRSNTMIVSTEIETVTNMVKLVSFMCQYSVQEMTLARYLQDLRSAVRTAGCDNKYVIVLIQADSISQANVYDAVNSLISIGEFDSLFNETELHGLVMALMPKIKKKHPIYRNDPKGFFTSCVKKFLRFVIILSPNNGLLQNMSRFYPGMSNGVNLIYDIDSTTQQLIGQAYSMLQSKTFSNVFDEKERNELVETLVKIHHYCQEVNTCVVSTDGIQSDLSNPCQILKRKINNITKSKSQSIVHFDYKIFVKFVSVFCRIFDQKLERLNIKCSKRRIALDCLVTARNEIESIENEKLLLSEKFTVIEKEVLEVNKQLFSKSSLIERLKAKLDIGTGSFKAFMSMIENEKMEPDVESVCLQEEQDELDMEYERLQSSVAGIKTLDEQIEETKLLLTSLEQEMNLAKESLLSFQVKIDRGCIERLRAYQSPPALVGTVMVMVMILMGRPEFSNFVASSGKREKHSGEVLPIHGSSHSRTSSAKSKRTPKANAGASIVTDGKVDRNLWKTIQQIMQDSQKFCENMNTHNWCEGVSEDVLHTVVSMFAKGEEVPLSERESQLSSVKPDSSQDGLSMQAARYSSEDAAQMVEYVQCVVHFTKKYRPYKVALRRLKSLEDEKAMREEEMKDLKKPEEVLCQEPEEEIDLLAGLDEESLKTLEKELQALHKHYDEVCFKKFNMKKKLEEFTVLLDTSQQLLSSLREMENSWLEQVDEERMKSSTLFDSLIGAAFLQYCGAFSIDKRGEMVQEIIKICKNFNGNLISKTSAMSFVSDKFETSMNEISNICNDRVSLDLMTLTMSHEVSCDWPLMIDPHGVGVYILNKVIPDLHVVTESQFATEIDRALQNGWSILVKDVSFKNLQQNTRLKSILRNHDMFFTSSTNFKLMVGEKEVECSSSFRMVLATTENPESLGDFTLWTRLSVNPIVVEFTRDMLVEIFLNQFLLKEKAQIEESYVETKQELAKLVYGRANLEEDLISFFTNNSSFQDLQLLRKILNVKNMHEEAYNYEIKNKEAIATLKKSRDIYKPIAIQAACLFQTVSAMRNLNKLYQLSIDQFFSYISVAINMSDRTGVMNMKQNILDLIHPVLSKGKFEEDRALFSLFLALELEDSQGRVSIGDREFLINPRYGALIKQPLPDQEKLEKIPPKSSLKKPFDWMSDEQYNNLLILSQNFDWFTETFEKMPKDGREMQWRQICEHDTPEEIPLPDNLDERYTPLQRLMVVRAFRSDRLIHAANVFVKTTLGKRFASDTVLDLRNMYHQTRPHVPILMYYDNDSLFGSQLLDTFAVAKQVTLVTYHVSNVPFENEKIKKLVCNLSQRGCWLHLAHIQANISVVMSLIEWLKIKKCDSSFRIWISTDLVSDFPVSFLHSCLPIMFIQPKNLKTTLMQSLLMVPGELWRVMYGSDFHPIVYNMCMFHSSLISRDTLAVPINSLSSQNCEIRFLLESLKVISEEVKRLIEENVETPSIHQIAYQNIKNLPWQYIRSYIHLFYGGAICTSSLSASFSSLAEFWISVNSTKKDFELSRARYRHPSVVFSNNLRCQSLVAAVDGVANFHSNEFTGLFDKELKSIEALTMFLQLKDLYVQMPGSTTLIHSKKSHSFNTNLGVCFTLHVNEMLEITNNVLAKLPRLWSKDFVGDRIRRTGGLTSFNMWLLREADAICDLHHAIKSDMNKLQQILSNSSDIIEYPRHMIQTAIDLMQNRIPEIWQNKAGPSPPSPGLSLNAWLNDFDARCKHIEKVLILGRERMPGYWLSAFFYPKRLLSVFKQEAFQGSSLTPVDKNNLICKMEITTRDKDHLRDPPSEGVFVYGVYLWGAHWEKATNELQDLPPKCSPYSLPVIHFQVIPKPEKYSLYRCPCYYSRKNTNEEIFKIDIVQKDIPSSRWALRNLVCTLRPF